MSHPLLKQQLESSLFIEEIRQAIEVARDTKAQFRLDVAARLMDSDGFEALPAAEQHHLVLLFSEAAFAVTGIGA